MPVAYKLSKDVYSGQTTNVLITREDGSSSSIPVDPDNTDYQEYLEWKAAGNTPTAAD